MPARRDHVRCIPRWRQGPRKLAALRLHLPLSLCRRSPDRRRRTSRSAATRVITARAFAIASSTNGSLFGSYMRCHRSHLRSGARRMPPHRTARSPRPRSGLPFGKIDLGLSDSRNPSRIDCPQVAGRTSRLGPVLGSRHPEDVREPDTWLASRHAAGGAMPSWEGATRWRPNLSPHHE